MDSKFEVFYFPIKGRAELVRLLLVAAKANWESKGVTDWPKEKFSTEGLLYKQVPMLIEHKSNGKELRLVQTGAIVRYIANKFNLVTECPCKNALLDSYFVGLYEFFNGVMGEVFSNSGKENFNEIIKEYIKSDFVKNNISYQEAILASNGSNGHYMDDKLTYVDVIAYGFVESYLNIEGLFTKETTPNLLKVYETVGQNPDIAAYLKSDKRPTN
ncbi:hypothetical protein H8356DRAFT_1647316 [Neocallimastix lanati (nom. inval.)]|jgi:glutathione S-transferase|uniref:Glutathione S-transferase n=1 Tax=Neocallimastix californiae TaxID=1754190 RepID=A0A1Y1ZDY0_9FUNG|nr:hypothetical protein H8356DRAFT_1647316 [Neocallimastix sp. JGI-2020a]ORY08502.1 hypothetical protein LY90DRAFT_709087 [Neocallimastix californiae]|eukprot:ORY08502.1 hypothetical protein LY90DRAFT_709087 [Neocallimastix californiae]